MYRTPRENSSWIDLLDPSLAKEVRHAMTLAEFDDGEPVYHAWSEFKGIYEILSGKVKLVSISPEGKELIVNIISENRTFGEAPICAGLKQTAVAAIAVGKTAVRLLPLKAFNELRAREAAINDAILQRVARRYMAQSTFVLDSSLHPIEFRLAYLLYTYAGDPPDGGSSAESVVQLTQNDLANMMGVTRQSIHRVMKGWQDEGHITLGYGEIIVHDFQVLLG